MGGSGTDKVFAGSIPKFYETYLVPLLFEPYAADLVNRLASRSPGRVLELAAGTGVVTRALASVLPERVSIVATDLNQPMLDQASALGTSAARGMASGGRHAVALPGRNVRRGRVPVRGHVLPRQGQSAFGGASSAPAGGSADLQCVGSDRGERVRGHRDGGTRIPVSRGSTPLPRPDAPRLSRACARSSRISPAAASWRHPRSSPWRRAAGQGPPGSRRLPSARGRHYEARSRRAARRGSGKQPMSPRKLSAGGSVAAVWMARCRPT